MYFSYKNALRFAAAALCSSPMILGGSQAGAYQYNDDYRINPVILITPEIIQQELGRGNRGIKFGKVPKFWERFNKKSGGTKAYDDLLNWLEDSEFMRVGNFRSIDGNPYAIINLPYAWASGYTGKGQLIAIGDSGFFEQNHEDFNDRIVGEDLFCYMPQSDSDDCSTFFSEDYRNNVSQGTHGARVSVLAGGEYDGGGLNDTLMMGVAYDASLLLIGLTGDDSGSLTNSMSETIAGLHKATELGAVAYNMSWGSPLHKDDDSGFIIDLDLDEDFQNALRGFQDSGVIVASLPNDPTTRSKLADRPFFKPDLQDAWISVGSADFTVTEDGKIDSATRQSAECGLSAAWCVFADGNEVRVFLSGLHTLYGTSFATPQVSGAIAILAERFPGSSPEQWAARLLASANNSFIGTTDVSTRQWNFSTDNNAAYDVTHDYSQEWGHGLVDMRAALSPIGNVFVTRGSDLYDASILVAEGLWDAPEAIRDAAQVAMKDADFTVFDSLGGDFTGEARHFVRVVRRKARKVAALQSRAAALTDAVSSEVGQTQYSATYDQDGFSFRTASIDHSFSDGVRLHFRYSDDTAYFNDPFMPDSGPATVRIGAFNLVGALNQFGASVSQGPLSGLSVAAFRGESAYENDATLWGTGVYYTHDISERTTVTAGAHFINEQGSYLGASNLSADNLWTGEQSDIASLRLGFRHDPKEDFGIFAQLEVGSVTGQDGAFVKNNGSAVYTGFEFGIEKKLTFEDTSALLTAWVSQPMRLEYAPVTFRLPSGIKNGSEVVYSEYAGDLVPEARQIDVGFSYSLDLSDHYVLGLAAMQSFNADHVAGASAQEVGAYFHLAF